MCAFDIETIFLSSLNHKIDLFFEFFTRVYTGFRNNRMTINRQTRVEMVEFPEDTMKY